MKGERFEVNRLAEIGNCVVEQRRIGLEVVDLQRSRRRSGKVNLDDKTMGVVMTVRQPRRRLHEKGIEYADGWRVCKICTYKDPDAIMAILWLEQANFGQVEVVLVIVDKSDVDLDRLRIDVAVIRDIYEAMRHAAPADEVQHVGLDREIQRGLGGEVVMVMVLVTVDEDIGPLVRIGVLRGPLCDVGTLVRKLGSFSGEVVTPADLWS